MTEIDYLREACRHAAMHSDDPATQVGAVLVGEGWTLKESNRIPDGVLKDLRRLERPAKYRYVEHAERGVIYAAARAGLRTHGAKLYCPWFACADCARAMICAGITSAVGLLSLRIATPARWEDDVRRAERMLCEANVSMRWIAGEVGETILYDGQLVDC